MVDRQNQRATVLTEDAPQAVALAGTSVRRAGGQLTSGSVTSNHGR